jgi:predicted dehydrogenase
MKILIVGVGSIGERHARCFSNIQGVDVGICDLDIELGKEVGEKYGIKEIGSRVDEMEITSFDAGVICTPANSHIPISRILSSYDLHLLIEKPLSTSIDGVEELIEISEKNQKIISVGYVFRSDEVLVSMRDALMSGKYGVPLHIIGSAGHFFPFYRPKYNETYYVDREQGGGAVQDAMTHMINAAEWLVGPVTRLVADVDHKFLKNSNVEDTVNVITRHEEVLGSYSLNQYQMPNETVLTVICSKGSLRYEKNLGRWLSSTTPGQDWEVEFSGGTVISGQELPDGPFMAQAMNFINAIKIGEEPSCSLEEALQTLKVNLAILESGSDGTWIDV